MWERVRKPNALFLKPRKWVFKKNKGLGNSGSKSFGFPLDLKSDKFYNGAVSEGHARLIALHFPHIIVLMYY